MIDERLVVLDSTLSQRDEVIDYLSKLATNFGYVRDRDMYLKEVYSRESEFSTAIGYGVSIPHGKTEGVNAPFISFMRTAKPITWDDNNNTAKLIFLLGVPEHGKSKLHLKILAEISKKLMDSDFRSQLANQNKDGVMSLLREVEENISENEGVIK